jgi:hypothetical protein
MDCIIPVLVGIKEICRYFKRLAFQSNQNISKNWMREADELHEYIGVNVDVLAKNPEKAVIALQES